MEEEFDCNCESIPVITVCVKCKRVLGVEKDTSIEKELDLTYSELLEFIDAKELNQAEEDC